MPNWLLASDMDRAMWEQHLAQAEAHVARGERTIARQRQIIAELERDGHDTTAARELLVQFLGILELHVADRDRLRRDLGLQTPGQ